jgi:hypothetical protein
MPVFDKGVCRALAMSSGEQRDLGLLNRRSDAAGADQPSTSCISRA